jgi:hypothetical protein
VSGIAGYQAYVGRSLSEADIADATYACTQGSLPIVSNATKLLFLALLDQAAQME